MDGVFGTTEGTAPVEATAVEKQEHKQKVAAMKAALKETVQTDPDFYAKLHRLSNSFRVINTLGAGRGDNIVVDKEAITEENKRPLRPASKTVGYKLQNIGEESVEYTTEEYTKDETGKWVGTVVNRVIAPGETICLTRQYMTMFCAQPEISFTLENGKIIGTSSKKQAKSLKEELSNHYFRFSKDENGATIQVNDDEVKLAVDDENGVVKPEYEKVFGFLNNPKETKTSRVKGQKFTTQDMIANYIHKMIQGNGI